MLIINSKLLVGMLTDLLKSTADATLPALHAVRLFTADHQGSPVLVGISTDRFTVAQAHESAEGELPAILLPVPAAKTVISALRGDKGVVAGTVVDDEKLVVQGTAAGTTVALLTGATFPETGWLFTDDAPTAVSGIMQFRPHVTEVFHAVAKRRKADVSMRYHRSEDGSPRAAQILIGQNYRSAAVPLMGTPDWALLAAPIFPAPRP